jgi:glutathione S-transferase
MLIDGDLAIWDSLSISNTGDQHSEAHLWPREPAARAIARSVSAEIHSGFQSLRQHCSMELLARAPLASVPPEVETDIRRILAIWRECRGRFGGAGPFLFSEFSAADAMYAPIASRFRTYVPKLSSYDDDGTAQAYVDTIFAMPEMEAWTEGARTETAPWTAPTLYGRHGLLRCCGSLPTDSRIASESTRRLVWRSPRGKVVHPRPACGLLRSRAA